MVGSGIVQRCRDVDHAQLHRLSGALGGHEVEWMLAALHSTVVPVTSMQKFFIARGWLGSLSPPHIMIEATAKSMFEQLNDPRNGDNDNCNVF